MTFLRNSCGTAEATATVAEHVVDRMVRNVAHGRFERRPTARPFVWTYPPNSEPWLRTGGTVGR